MDPWPITIAARRSLLTTFEQLDAAQWETASLCGGWTVRQVLAHLLLAHHPPRRRYASAMFRARGNFDRANDALAREEALRPVDDVVADYRVALEHRFAPPGWPAGAPLTDILLHALDVRVPLGIDDPEAPEHYAPSLAMLLGRFGWVISGRGRPETQWVATDHDWSHGSGPAVRGRMADLTLAAGGRTARLDALEGDGVAAVRTWLS